MNIAQRAHWRTWLVWIGLIVALAAVNRGIFVREHVLAEGRLLLLELAPVDPRSLMQGDYMALRFAAAEPIEAAFDPKCESPPPAGEAAPARTTLECMAVFEKTRNYDGYAVFAVGADDVGRFVRVQPAVAPAAAGEVAVRVRVRGWDGARIASNAWFFPEGQAQRYEPARYGELRIGEDGVALLTGMRDEARKPL